MKVEFVDVCSLLPTELEGSDGILRRIVRRAAMGDDFHTRTSHGRGESEDEGESSFHGRGERTERFVARTEPVDYGTL